MSLHSIRERINIWLFGHKDVVLRAGRMLNILVSIVAILTVAYLYGFDHDENYEEKLFLIIKASFSFYVLHYLVKIIYDFHPLQFIKRTWFEGLMMFLLVVEGVSDSIFDTLLLETIFKNLGFAAFGDISTVFVQVYFFVVVIIEIASSRSVLPRVKLNPAIIFIVSFLFLISAGTGLLMLPEMTTIEGNMNFLDALFTSTSATCVTGLMVEDTPTFFTFKGQVVLLILIKLGGLNIIAFGSFLALASKLGVGVQQHEVIEDFVNRDSFLSASRMLGKVILWSTGIELAGAFLMFLSWENSLPTGGTAEAAFYSIFHSVSAFNNAGISLFTDGLANSAIANNYIIHWLVTILVFFGALGMMAMFDLFDINSLRNRMKQPWKQIQFSTKIALYFSIWLVIGGSLLYFILEQNGTLAGQGLFGQITTSVFQSVTRTSGFNTVDIGAVGVPMLFVLIILMFIGSSSSSTGGGIKTSTLAIIYSDVLATIKGRDYPELFKRSISKVLKSRAYSVLLFFIFGNLVCIFLLSITESHILAQPGRSILDLMFEEVSALGTVGLSTGITAELSLAGKLILVLSMFVGRVGTLTVAFALAGKIKKKRYKYPEGHTMVG